jgi:hypothetical protein
MDDDAHVYSWSFVHVILWKGEANPRLRHATTSAGSCRLRGETLRIPGRRLGFESVGSCFNQCGCYI